MPAPLGFVDRLKDEVLPTKIQAFGALLLALLILVFIQSKAVVSRLGITPQAISASEDQFHSSFDVVLRSTIASHLALVTFWALVGLIAYLICWGAYNILIEARNEVTLNTAYTNRGHWRGPYETLALKAVAAVGLAGLVISLWGGTSFWVSLSSGVFTSTTPTTIGLAVLAIIGMAVQLYAILVFIQLTFTPWYRAETFTEA